MKRSGSWRRVKWNRVELGGGGCRLEERRVAGSGVDWS